MRFRAVVVRSLAVLLAVTLAAASPAPPPQDELARAIGLVNEGDFEAAVVALSAALTGLESQPGTEASRVQAQLYLGVAYLELDQEVTARSKFREVLRLDPSLRLDPGSFSPQVIRTFEAARAESALPAPILPAAAGPRPTSAATATPAPTGPVPAEPEKKKKKRNALPFILIAGGGVAAAGVAVASGGGGGGTQGGGTTTTTTAPGATTPSTTSTTTTTTQAPAPTTTTTTTTTTTVPPRPSACVYDMTPSSQSFDARGGDGTCRVSTGAGCDWTAESTRDWIVITGGESGQGEGVVRFRVAPNTDKNSRDGRIRLRNTTAATEARCEIEQTGAPSLASLRTLVFTSTLDMPGGTAQVVVDGLAGSFQERVGRQSVGTEGGAHRVEGILVTGEGKPGLWRFELDGTFESGTLRPIAGDLVNVGPGTIVFRLAGRPGERVAFAFRTAP